MGAPGFVRSRAYTMSGKGVCTYITLLITNGLPSCPVKTPVENVHAAVRFFTFDVVICFSGLYRCWSYVRPAMAHSPTGGFTRMLCAAAGVASAPSAAARCCEGGARGRPPRRSWATLRSQQRRCPYSLRAQLPSTCRLYVDPRRVASVEQERGCSGACL